MRPEIITFDRSLPVRAEVKYAETVPYHWHDALEVILVLEGEIQISFGPENQRLQSGHVAIFNVEEVHRIYEVAPGSRLLQIQIDPSFCERLNPEFKHTFFYCCSAYMEKSCPQRYENLKEHLLALHSALETMQPGEEEETAGKLAAALTYMIDNFDYLQWGPGNSHFDKKRVQQLKQLWAYAIERYADRLDLGDLAQQLNISPHHLSHTISDLFEQTFQNLLSYHRLEQAVKLLLGTDKRILDISFECGFSDVKYLIQTFKRHYGCTPSQFRRLHQASK